MLLNYQNQNQKYLINPEGNSIIFYNSAPFNQHHSVHRANQIEACNNCKFRSVKNSRL